MDTIDCPKCEHEHQPNGSHEDDIGKWECEACGFNFFVEIEYDPSYSTSCEKHEYGEKELYRDAEGTTFWRCKNCQGITLKEPTP